MKRQPPMSASEQADNKRYSQSKSDCDNDEMLRGGALTQGAPTSGQEQREASQGQPLERRTAPSLRVVTLGALRQKRSSVLSPCAKKLSFYAMLAMTCRPLSLQCPVQSPVGSQLARTNNLLADINKISAQSVV